MVLNRREGQIFAVLWVAWLHQNEMLFGGGQLLLTQWSMKWMDSSLPGFTEPHREFEGWVMFQLTDRDQ